MCISPNCMNAIILHSAIIVYDCILPLGPISHFLKLSVIILQLEAFTCELVAGVNLVRPVFIAKHANVSSFIMVFGN